MNKKPSKLPSYTLNNVFAYITDECNLNCRHCWIDPKYTTRSKKINPSIQQYKSFINQAIPLGLKYMKITGGEPFIQKQQVLQLMKYLKNKKINCIIESNGTLIDEEITEAILETDTSISISLDAMDQNLHDLLRGDGACKKTMKGIKILKENDIPIEIISAIYKKNIDELENIVEFVLTLPKKSFLKINPISSMGRAKKMAQNNELLGIGDMFELIKKVDEKILPYFKNIVIDLPPSFFPLNLIAINLCSGGKCNFLNLLGILANGDISFCGMGYSSRKLIFGNIKQLNLKSIFEENRLLNSVRKKISQHKFMGICNKCVMKFSCKGGCRAIAYDAYDSMLAPSPLCELLYKDGLFPKTRLIENN